MYVLFCIMMALLIVLFQPEVLPVAIALVAVIVGYKKGWFKKQTKEDLNDIAIMAGLMDSDDKD